MGEFSPNLVTLLAGRKYGPPIFLLALKMYEGNLSKALRRTNKLKLANVYPLI
jgi:hypothetical protein